jgi:hypothetical protein
VGDNTKTKIVINIAQSGTDIPSLVRAADQTNQLYSGSDVLAVAAGDLFLAGNY